MFESTDRQARRYLTAKPGRNRGPKGRWPSAPMRTTFLVAHEVDGNEKLLTRPLHSRRQCKRVLRRLRAYCPGAYGLTSKMSIRR